MKKITITRNKAYAACLAKANIYVCDGGDVYDLEINGFRCKHYGKIKNGETRTIEVPDTATRVYITFDKLSAGYCNDVYILPEGIEEINLTGKCEFNPATGNAFRFDNNDNPEALSNRSKGTNKGVIILVVCVCVGSVVGFIIGFSGIFASLF
ncbi:MAG: hypothetical protein ACI4MN_04425 [Candidatus Coproplasma sp.]